MAVGRCERLQSAVGIHSGAKLAFGRGDPGWGRDGSEKPRSHRLPRSFLPPRVEWPLPSCSEDNSSGTMVKVRWWGAPGGGCRWWLPAGRMGQELLSSNHQWSGAGAAPCNGTRMACWVGSRNSGTQAACRCLDRGLCGPVPDPVGTPLRLGDARHSLTHASARFASSLPCPAVHDW